MFIEVEEAKDGDLEKLCSIERECFTIEAFSKNHMTSLLQHPSSSSLVAKINGEIVGFIIASIYDGEKRKIGHVVTLDVGAKARRRGVGSRLLRSLEQVFKNRGVQVCYLEVRLDNVAARELYRKLGYVEVELLKDLYCRGGHGVRMEKILQKQHRDCGIRV